ncbi:MAG: hypothetical protein NDJ89_10800 [Oligoflexia bacterium]|nr:hypothetical protein [Oligoflexia bacterium]
MKTQEFVRIIEASLDELVSLKLERPDSGLTDGIYLDVILHYQRAERSELAKLVQLIPETDGVWTASRLRLMILERKIDPELLARAERQVAAVSSWEGELSILIGMTYTILERHAIARGWFHRAIGALERIGARRKAVKAFLNVVVADTHVYPERNPIAAYHDVYRRAMRPHCRELSVASTALLNISREYQEMGASLAALKFCNQAVKLIARDFGSLTYFLALAHRCNLLLELERLAEARVDYELAKASGFAEVQAALEVLSVAFSPEELSKSCPEALPAGWRRRREAWLQNGGIQAKVRLSALEEKLVRLLGKGPRSGSFSWKSFMGNGWATKPA